jgi:hypothetical protein
LQWMSRTLRKTLTPAMLCSTRTRTFEMRRLPCFSCAVSRVSCPRRWC